MTLSFVLTVKFFLIYLLSSYLWNSYSSFGGINPEDSTDDALENGDGGGGGGFGFGSIRWPSLSELIPPLLLNQQNNSTIDKLGTCIDDDSLFPMTIVEKYLPCHDDVYDNDDDDDKRIVDGTPVAIGQRLYQIALFRGNNFACGGTFITRRFILTAAHCVRGYKPEDLKIRYASRQYDNGPMMTIHSVYIHPDYNASLVENDIALLRLSYPLPKIPLLIGTAVLNDDVKIDLETNKSVIVSGWGRTGRSLPVSKRLLMATLRIVNKQQCQQQWESMFNVNSESMICASDTDKSACNGDSGGPLTTMDDKLIGIVSVGSSSCLSFKRPNIYTNVAYFHDWIQKTISEHF
ncbi:Group 9 mite allergen-like protein (serine protease) [Euroglyphus maynei]|uniref:Group 9 mite allergen-like protein (Serine protease) n=1 Tax=Euroglyphus maynei TaxID=6958 RepID=A0A1Y3B953_EURMA|nr:Group 9 mite allergen-like protein (serine protease) [Euroglyphus maynei]